MLMKINELFYTLQGEGSLAGTPSGFIRTSKCNLRCSWCDTPYTSWNPEFTEQSVDSIVQQVKKFTPAKHVVITGGEPYLERKELPELVNKLVNDYHVTIETNATIYVPTQAQLISLSPKLSNSTPHADTHWGPMHERYRLHPAVIQAFVQNHKTQTKFVVNTEQDFKEGLAVMRELAIPQQTVYFMPEGRTEAECKDKARWLWEKCKEESVRYCPRLHVELYGATKGI